jgi:tRNA nucleotidyltransferase (CCA-adding enzyme)
MNMKTSRWDHFEHEADIGVRATAPSRETLFERLAEALTAIITEPDRVRSVETITIHCEAPDDAMLLVDWLNALVYEMSTRRMVFGAWHVELDGLRLTARVSGETVDRTRHQPVVEVKGATYTALSVEQDEQGLWHGQCVVDV